MSTIDIKTVYNNTSLSDWSIKTYTSNLKQLVEAYGKDIDYIIDHPEDVVTFINLRYDNNKTRKAHINAIHSLFKHAKDLRLRKPELYKKWDKYAKNINGLVNEHYKEQQATERQASNMIEWEEFLNKMKELGQKDYGGKKHLLLAMYGLEPPKRQDYGACRIFKREPSKEQKNLGNYIVLTESKAILVMNDYKTSKTYNQQRFELVEDLRRIIQKSIDKYPREYLFVNPKNEPYTDRNFTQFSNRALESIFGKNLTINLLRHMYVGYRLKKGMTYKEMLELSERMGHSYVMQGQYFLQNNDNKVCKIVCSDPGSSQMGGWTPSQYASLEESKIINSFLEKHVIGGGEKDTVYLGGLYDCYKQYCKTKGENAIGKKLFENEMHMNLKEANYKERTKHHRNVWVGYSMKE